MVRARLLPPAADTAASRLVVRCAAWVVRRAGLTRTALALTAVGLATAALWTPTARVGWALFLGLGLTVLGAAAARRPGRRAWTDVGQAVIVCALLVAALGGGLLVGAGRVAALAPREVSPSVEGRRVTVEGTVTGPVRPTRRGAEAALAVRSARSILGVPEGICGATVLLRVEGDKKEIRLESGAVVRVDGRLQQPLPGSGDGYDEARLLARRGMALILATKADRVTTVGHRGGLAAVIDRVRVHARRALGNGLNESEAALLRGVVLGEKGTIDPALMDAFRRSGTAHILAVSGLHVASLSAAVLLMAGLARLRRRSASLLAMVLVVVFALVTGAGPSVVRASVMGGAAMLAWIAGRGRDPWQGFFAAACVVLVIDPQAVLSAGFQLSFAAVGGLFALSPAFERAFLAFLPRWLAAALAISCAASLATAPLSLAHFGQTSAVAVIANLFVVPVTGPVMVLGLASISAGVLWEPAGALLNIASVVLLSWAAMVARFFAAAPVLTTAHLAAAGAAVAALIAVFPVACRAAGRSPPSWCGWASWSRLRLRPPRSPLRRLSLVVLLLVLAVVAGLGTWEAVRYTADRVVVALGRADWPAGGEVRVLDVGQGNAVLIRTSGGHAALIDGGPADAELPRQLAALGVKELEVAVISHPHADHFAGLAAEGIPSVKLLVDGVAVRPPERPGGATLGPPGQVSGLGAGRTAGVDGEQAEAVAYLRMRRRVTEDGGRIVQAADGLRLRLDEVAIELSSPRRAFQMEEGGRPWSGPPPSGDRLNEGSLVAVVRSGSIAILVPGDAETRTLERLDLGPVDVLVVPHHGSRGALSTELLDSLRPRLACISVGDPNPFGHPDPTTVACLQEAGVQLMRTDRSGSLTIPLGSPQAPSR